MSDHFDERAIVMEDGSRYLEVCHRLSDARKDGCRVVTDLVYHDERMAVFKAEVYNSADRKLAEAYGSRLAAVEPYYLEHAETGAIGRCLSEAGYNLYTYELSDNIEDHAITLDEGEEYLNVPYRVAMFKKEHPEALITKKLLNAPEAFKNGIAVVEVRIIEASVTIATAHAQRKYEDDEKKRNFIEFAETAAIGRALSILGYDLPPGKGNQFSDAGDVADAPAAAKASKDSGKAQKEAKNPEKPKTASRDKADKKQDESKEKRKGNTENKYADPENYIAPSGQQKGKTLKQIWDHDWTCLRRIAYDEVVAQRAEPEYVAMAKALCEKHGVHSISDLPDNLKSQKTQEQPKNQPEKNISEYIIPSGKFKGIKLGVMWNKDWEYIRKLAYDERVRAVAEPELVANAKAYCEQHGIFKMSDKPQNKDSKEKAAYTEEEIKAAGDTIINAGLRFRDQSIREVFKLDKGYLKWMAYEATTLEESLIRAAKVYYETHI